MLIQLGKALTKVDFLKSQWVIGFTCIRSHHFIGNRWGISGNSVRLYFLGALKSPQMVTAAMKLKEAYSLEEKL